MMSGDEFAEPGEEAVMYGRPIDAREIHKLLRELFPDTEPPAKRTIQLAVEDGWEMLKKKFGDHKSAGGISS